MGLQQERRYFWAAMMFYTRIRVPADVDHSEEILNNSRKYFPLIGVLLGCIAALIVCLVNTVLPLSIAILLSMAGTILITGSFHEDGFADCCDGFGGGWQKDQVLTIMKDSRVGAYALAGLILMISIKFVSLYEIGIASLPLLLITYVNAHGLSRFGASLSIECLDYVQDSEKSKIKPITSMSLDWQKLALSGAFILPALIALLCLKLSYLFVLFPLMFTFIIGNYYFKKRIGGYTGDCLGAMQQMLEVVFYISILAIS